MRLNQTKNNLEFRDTVQQILQDAIVPKVPSIIENERYPKQIDLFLATAPQKLISGVLMIVIVYAYGKANCVKTTPYVVFPPYLFIHNPWISVVFRLDNSFLFEFNSKSGQSNTT